MHLRFKSALSVMMTLAALALLFSNGMKQQQIVRLEHDLTAQRRATDQLSEHALSQVYLNRVLCGWLKVPNETYTSTMEVITATLIGDVHLADMALSLPLSEQRKYEFIMFAYSAYEDLHRRTTNWPEQFVLPDFDWSSTETLERSVTALREFPPKRHWGKIDGITGASLDVPRFEKWASYKEFKTSFDRYRYRPNSIVQQDKARGTTRR